MGISGVSSSNFVPQEPSNGNSGIQKLMALLNDLNGAVQSSPPNLAKVAALIKQISAEVTKLGNLVPLSPLSSKIF